MADSKKLEELVFGAEKNSAAAMDQEKLERYHEIAEKMFNTPVLRPREIAFPSIADFASYIMKGLETYRTLYFVNVLRIDMVYVTAILTLISIYDTLNDPIMDIIYDRTRTRWGKARPYLLFTPFPYFISTAVLYSGATFLTSSATDDPKKIIFVFVMLFIQETFSTIYTIPRNNMPSLMTPNPQDRITLGVVQGYFGQLGSQLVYGLFMPIQDLNRWGLTNISMPIIFAILGWVSAAFGIVGNLAMAFGCKERIMLQPKPAPFTKTMFYILKNKYMLRNFIAALLSNWWSGGGYSWDVVTQLEIFGGAFKSALFYSGWNFLNPISVALVKPLQKAFKFNNRNAYIFLRFWGVAINIITFLAGVPFIEKSWLVGLSYFICYSINALDNAPGDVISAEINREITDYTEYKTGERPDATIGMVTGLLSKVTSPLNALMTIAVFKWSGYDATIPMAPWSQNNKSVYLKVYFLYQAGSFFPNLVQTIPYFFYDLVGEKRKNMYIALNERRALIAKDTSDEDEELAAMMDMLGGEEKAEGKPIEDPDDKN